jgi:hypothetical protein
MRVENAASIGWIEPNYTNKSSSAASVSSSSPVGPTVDEVTFSPGARVLAGVVEGSTRIHGDLGPIRIENVRADYQRQLESLEHSLKQQFARRRIDESTPIRLQTAADGRVFVAGDHPQKEVIEQIFVDDPKLQQQFAKVDSQASFLHSVDEAIAFQQAYRQNPTLAVQQFAHLFDGREPPAFALQFRGGEFNTMFF